MLLESVFLRSLDGGQYWEAGHPPPPHRRVLFNSFQMVSGTILGVKLAVSNGHPPPTHPPPLLSPATGAY